ncbi:MAG: DNA repair protein RadA [Candidatus Pacebacteria bacterium]|nr:DNA repair protein RadA [Candidatus Paceibacterota bacterium]
MAKSSSSYICQSCEEAHAKWQGQCNGCGAWNTLVEQIVEKSSGKSSKSTKKIKNKNILVKFSEVDSTEGFKKRISTKIGEFDRVLGSSSFSNSDEKINGGIVPGAVMLIGGEPGIGKSTILTQMVVYLASSDDTGPILYVSGEESPSQIGLRIERIISNEQKNIRSFGKLSIQNIKEKIIFVTSTDVDEVCQIIRKEKPYLVIIDSVQTLSTEDLTGAAGSTGQIRESADRITTTVKLLNIPTFLVGHVTKEGSIAGPKILEHIVDAVLELSGERTGDLRILRAIKNRFGATDEVGVFKIDEFGLQEISNPSQVFLEHLDMSVPGSSTVCMMEGTRPLLLEVQALVLKSQLAMPRRVGRGVELSRIQVLSAILEKHCGLPLGFTDVFLSAAGGIKIKEPSVDLGLAVAMASSLKNKSLPNKTIFIGEVGLLGEVRNVSYLDRRIKEAKRLGYTNVISRKTHKRVKDVLKELKLL